MKPVSCMTSRTSVNGHMVQMSPKAEADSPLDVPVLRKTLAGANQGRGEGGEKRSPAGRQTTVRQRPLWIIPFSTLSNPLL